MKRNTLHIARTTLVSISIATLYTSLAATAHAGGPCSLARAAGNWSLTDNGTVVGIGPRVAVGIFTLDADGNLLNGKGTSSLNGGIAEETFSGTYTVNSDCTGTITVKIFDTSAAELFTVTLNIAFDENMRHMRGIFKSVVAPNGAPLSTVIAFDANKQ